MKCYSFRQNDVDEKYIEKIGLDPYKYRKFHVVERDDEIFVFFPLGGGYENIMKTLKSKSQIIAWIQHGVSKIGCALDLDERSAENLIDSVKQRLSTKYGDVREDGNYTLKVTIDRRNFYVTIIPLGDLNISEKISELVGKDLKFRQHKIEDLLIYLAIQDDSYRRIMTQAIDFYFEKKSILCGKIDFIDQKSIIKMLESLCRYPDYGIYELITEVFDRIEENIKNLLPPYLTDSLEEFLNYQQHR